MTIQETTQILFMLSAYYGEGKSNAKLMAAAWQAILGKYDFGIVQESVIEFARNDARDYATFPTPGKLVAAIEDRLSIRNGIINAKLAGQPYKSLHGRYKQVITEDGYNQITRKAIEQSREQVFRGLLPRPQAMYLE